MNPSSFPAAASSRLSLLPWAPVSARALVWSFVAGLALTLPAMWFVAQLRLPELAAAQAPARAGRMLQLYLHPGLLALKAVVIYPLLEELFYRGAFQQVCRRYLPAGVAVTLPNLVFAITHLGSGWTNVGFALLVGLFFSWLVIRSRSLLPAIVCHAGINAVVLFVFRPLLDSGAFAPDLARFPGTIDAALVMLVSLAVLGTGWHLLREEFNPRQPALAA